MKLTRLIWGAIQKYRQSRPVEIDQLRLEKNLELYRFAEFGKLSAGFLHDLSNPLTAVSLTFGQLESSYDARLASEIRDSITHMEQYVNSARRQLNRQNVDEVFNPVHAINQVLSLLKTKATTHKVTIEHSLEGHVRLYGDSVKLSQVVANVVSNAIDAYSGTDITQPRYVTIKLKSKDGHAVLSITDCGIGIDDETMKRIFDPFFSTKSSDRGTGIGLTITKRIIEDDFAGKLHVRSKLGKGTEFTVLIPLAAD